MTTTQNIVTYKEDVRELLLDGRWHTTSEINNVLVGGSEGTRRLRELRAEGAVIHKRRICGSSQFEYRLVLTPVIPQ